MEKSKTRFRNAWPYQKDRMNLPVENLETALPFYQATMGFRLVAQSDTPHPSAVLERDNIRIGLAENGGDPTQDGCFFEVNDVAAARAEMQSNGLAGKQLSEFSTAKYGSTTYTVFFVVAPDGLCYCLGERQP